MRPLNVLLTNNTLAFRAGSELYVRDVAVALKKRGHRPMAYSQLLGTVADDIRAAGVPVVEDLNQLSEAPDIIHGQHHLETMAALLRFPTSPAIFVCHGYVPWQEHPPLFPRILRYVAVDHACRDRLLANGIAPSAIQLIFNFADLTRFLPRGPLPASPQKALVLSNYVREENFLPVIREACRRAGIELQVAGLSCGRPCDEPETLLPQHDLVFAKARAAIEALAVGCAVITCDSAGLGCLVTSGNLDRLRELNFGFRTLTRAMEVQAVGSEIARYNPADALEVSRRMRSLADMETAVDQLLGVYQEVIAEFDGARPDREQEEKAASVYLSWLAKLTKGFETKLQSACDSSRAENAVLNSKLQEENGALRHALQNAKARWNIGWPFHSLR